MKEYYFIKPDPDFHSNLMAFGIECGKGWYPIIEEAFNKMEKAIEKMPKKERKIFEKSFEILQVKEKLGCYDSETEVLTKDGWKYFRDVNEEDLIATLKDGKELEYQIPINIFKYSYKGKMYKLQTRGVDLLVTPNHNLYIAKPDKIDGTHYKPYKRIPQPFSLSTYDELYLKNKKFKKNTIWFGKEINTFTVSGYSYTNFMKLQNKDRTYTLKDFVFDADYFLDFLGWYIAEGCADYKKGDICIACNNTDGGLEKEKIIKVISKLGFPIKTSAENKPALLFRIYSTSLARWLIENCGYGAKNKKIPGFVKELSPRQIRILLNSLYLGDGHKTKTTYTLTTISKQLSDDVQELIFKCGDTFREYSKRIRKPTSLIKGKINPAYEINWMKLKFHNTRENGLAKNSFEGLIDYNDFVYCVEVPNHIVYVRRKGKAIWCGNSLKIYVNMYTNEITEIIRRAEEKALVTCEVCGKPGKMRCVNFWYFTNCNEHYNKRLKENENG